MIGDVKKKLVLGFIWSFLGQAGYILVSLLTNIVLARILGPEIFGKIGIIMFFIVIAKVLTESGLSGALIRKKEVNEDDYSTVFIFNIAISVILFLIIVLSSNTIAKYYNDEALQKILIVTSCVLLINAFQIVQNIKVVRALNFKKKATYELIAVTIASLTGIILAIGFNGGIWAVVAVQLLTATITTVLYWVFEGPIKKLTFDVHSFKSMYKYGINTTSASLLNTAFDNIYQLLLAKNFAFKQTGLYFQAKKIQEVPVGIIKSTTLGVVFAALAKVQDNLSQFNRMYNKIITIFSIAVGFICLFVFFYAENIILLLYGKEWIEAVFYMQILILSSFFYMQEMFNRVIFKVFDRTDKILILEIIKKSIQTVTIIIGIYFLSIKLLLLGVLVTSILSYFINYYHSRKIFGSFSWYEIQVIVKIIFIGLVTYSIGILAINEFKLDGYKSFCLVPLLIISYTGLIEIIKVSKLLKDIIYIKNLISKKNV